MIRIVSIAADHWTCGRMYDAEPAVLEVSLSTAKPDQYRARNWRARHLSGHRYEFDAYVVEDGHGRFAIPAALAREVPA